MDDFLSSTSTLKNIGRFLSFRDFMALRSSCKRTYESVSYRDYWNLQNVFEKALLYGNLSVIKDLLFDRRVDLNKTIIQSKEFHGWSYLRYAMAVNRLETVKVLLSNPNVDPSADGNFAIVCAAKTGNARLLKQLMQDARVDPSTSGSNQPLLKASEMGHYEVVGLLLNHPNVNPTFRCCEALKLAENNGHMLVLRRLLYETEVARFLGLHPFRFQVHRVIKIYYLNIYYTLKSQAERRGQKFILSNENNDKIYSVKYLLSRKRGMERLAGLFLKTYMKIKSLKRNGSKGKEWNLFCYQLSVTYGNTFLKEAIARFESLQAPKNESEEGKRFLLHERRCIIYNCYLRRKLYLLAFWKEWDKTRLELNYGIWTADKTVTRKQRLLSALIDMDRRINKGELDHVFLLNYDKYKCCDEKWDCDCFWTPKRKKTLEIGFKKMMLTLRELNKGEVTEYMDEKEGTPGVPSRRIRSLRSYSNAVKERSNGTTSQATSK